MPIFSNASRHFAGVRRLRFPASALAALMLASSTVPERGWAGPAPDVAESIPAAAPDRVRPPVAPLDAEADAWVEATLAQLDLRQRVAQLVMPWIRGGSIPRNSEEFRRIRRWIEQDRVGGLIVSRGSIDEFAPMMNALQSFAPVPLLIVSDLETGPGMRLTGGTNLPPAMAFGASGSESLAREAGRITAVEARAAGIHMTLGPVLDVNSNPFNPIINTRSFGEDPVLVGRMAAAWIEGAKEGGLLTAGKHFPGHGATEVDSHVGLPTVNATRAELDALDLVPFDIAIDAGMDGVLVGHIAVPEIDGQAGVAASMSAGVVGGILREDLAFDGLVFTDALNMGAITRHHTVAEASIRALLAGADVLLQPPGERAVIDAIVAAVESGRLPRERIDESARRVLRAKAVARLHTDPGVRAAGGRPPAAHGNLAGRLATASLTLARDHADLVPLPADARRILHVAYAGSGTSFSGGTVNTLLRGAGRTVDAASVGERTTAAAYRDLAARARRADLVIISANLVPREYLPLALGAEFSRFAESLTAEGVPVVAVSFGSPYLLGSFPSVPTYLLAWSAGAAGQRAAARALLGEQAIEGRLPVSLPPHHGIGEGIQRAGR